MTFMRREDARLNLRTVWVSIEHGIALVLQAGASWRGGCTTELKVTRLANGQVNLLISRGRGSVAESFELPPEAAHQLGLLLVDASEPQARYVSR